MTIGPKHNIYLFHDNGHLNVPLDSEIGDKFDNKRKIGRGWLKCCRQERFWFFATF